MSEVMDCSGICVFSDGTTMSADATGSDEVSSGVNNIEKINKTQKFQKLNSNK